MTEIFYNVGNFFFTKIVFLLQVVAYIGNISQQYCWGTLSKLLRFIASIWIFMQLTRNSANCLIRILLLLFFAAVVVGSGWPNCGIWGQPKVFVSKKDKIKKIPDKIEPSKSVHLLHHME